VVGRSLAALLGVAVGAIRDGALAVGGAPNIWVGECAVLLEASRLRRTWPAGGDIGRPERRAVCSQRPRGLLWRQGE